MGLVLTRKQGEVIVITTPEGNTITVRVRSIVHSNQVKLEFVAPRDHKIYRAELLGTDGEPFTGAS